MHIYSHPLLSGDGKLTALEAPKLCHNQQIDFNFAEAIADITWKLDDLGTEVTTLLNQNGNNPNSNTFEVQIHIRSFLARSGLDAEILELGFRGDSFTAKVQLKFLVDRVTQDGSVEFPLEKAFRDHLNKTAPIKVANLVFFRKKLNT